MLCSVVTISNDCSKGITGTVTVVAVVCSGCNIGSGIGGNLAIIDLEDSGGGGGSCSEVMVKSEGGMMVSVRKHQKMRQGILVHHKIMRHWWKDMRDAIHFM